MCALRAEILIWRGRAAVLYEYLQNPSLERTTLSIRYRGVRFLTVGRDDLGAPLRILKPIQVYLVCRFTDGMPYEPANHPQGLASRTVESAALSSCAKHTRQSP